MLFTRFYLRRVRLSTTSELVEALREAGYPLEPAVGDPRTVVVEIPVDVGEGVRTLSEVRDAWTTAALITAVRRVYPLSVWLCRLLLPGVHVGAAGLRCVLAEALGRQPGQLHGDLRPRARRPAALARSRPGMSFLQL